MSDEYFLVFRDNTLFKAKKELLADFAASKTSCDALSAAVEDALESISSIKANFSDNYYSKSDLNASFCSIQTVSNLTANSEYALVSAIPAKISSLQTIPQVDVWYAKEAKYCAKYLLREYDQIDGIMKKSTEFDAADYIRVPNVDSVIDENGNLVENTGRWE